MKQNQRILSSHRTFYQPAQERFLRPDKKKGNRRETVYRDYYSQVQGHKTLRKIKIALGIIAVFLIGQSIFQVPFLRIKNIEIRGLKYTPIDQVQPFITQELSRRRWIIFRNDNYLLLRKDLLKERLEERYFLKTIDIKKFFPSKLLVTVQERISGFTIQTPDGYYSLDTKGNKVGEIVRELPKNITVIADERTDQAVVPSVDFLEKATQIREQWEQVVPQGLVLDKFHLTDDYSVITISTNKKFKILFDPKSDIEKQLARLAVFLSDTSIEEPREYIDLRFDSSLYIR